MPKAVVRQSPLLRKALGSEKSTFSVHEFKAGTGIRDTSPRGIPLHVHRTEEEAWYIIEGKLRFQLAKQTFDASAGDGVLLPRGVPHTFWNPGPRPARYLLIVGPKAEGLLRALHIANPPPQRDLRALYARFGCELVE